MTSFSDEIKVKIEGHVKIVEYEDECDVGDESKGKVLLNQRNAIHPEHTSLIIARGLAHRDNGYIYSMWFGSGGATIDPLGNIIYATPNTSGAADLNTPVYFEVVDDNSGAPSGNQMSVRHINGTLFSDDEIRCVIDKNEPFGQQAFDNVGSTNINSSAFVFDEIALKSKDDLLITHIVFSPIEKSANRIIEVVYVLRVRIAN
mgnify:CR=1 FL=1